MAPVVIKEEASTMCGLFIESYTNILTLDPAVEVEDVPRMVKTWATLALIDISGDKIYKTSEPAT